MLHDQLADSLSLSRHRRQAMEFVLTGDSASGAEFERLGVVNKAFPRDQVISAATNLAERIALMSGPVIQVAKQAVLTGKWPIRSSKHASCQLGDDD